ncbi:Zn(II)2Cys6 transcription factor domain-containing protein [Aspergillus mulundensis]|uniref:Zn(2)-C6 fungal-type domain-containing protein n=1 Tax=Aspergillus mulundensis TaxID=1810919 RepID=A0A3D8QF73_9EURO|nr:hypothetical protein DSM5745_10964 [Aspergillus mulundensis]RDW60506.1 hypothetical protein DSM5745_10964 [Aspergillus mulundensis]
MSALIRTGPSRLKSKTGCKTCKIRRVKCGEEKPHCLRCTSTGRWCDYARPAATRRDRVAVSRVLPTASPESRERRAFEYYFFHAAPCLSDVLDLDFWRGTVLQMCRTEPAIWDAIAALGTFYEQPPPIRRIATYQVEDTNQLSRPGSGTHREAFAWYSRSLKRLQRQIERGAVSHAVALMIQGNVKDALRLYHQGMQLMESIPESLRSNIEAAITSILLRIGTIAVIITRDTPFPARLPRFPSASKNFTSLSDARSALYTLVAEWKVLDEGCAAIREASYEPANQDSIARLQQNRDALEHSLFMWNCQFSRLPEVIDYNTPTPKTSRNHQGIIAVLSMTYHSILILTQTALSTSESSYDAYESTFTKLISHAARALAGTATQADTGTQPPFIFDMGTAMSLFITVMKCRSPFIRRQALYYLLQAPPLQGMHFPHSAADFLAAVVAVEEGGAVCEEKDLMLGNVLARPGRVPVESERIFSLSLHPWRTHQGEMRTALRYARRVTTVDGGIEVDHRTVVLPARSPHRRLTIL